MKQRRTNHQVRRIISGGQTGVDRGALDAAIGLGIPHGGWCPRGRRAEDGVIPARYQLDEHDSAKYASRTKRNVVESDATLILHLGPLSGGTELTARLALRHGRPLKTVDLAGPPALADIRDWLRRHQISVLNVAGPRESQQPGIGQLAVDLLLSLFSDKDRGKHSAH